MGMDKELNWFVMSVNVFDAPMSPTEPIEIPPVVVTVIMVSLKMARFLLKKEQYAHCLTQRVARGECFLLVKTIYES